MAPPIPDRWIPYKACGKVIEGTRIICFKVPLRKAVQVGKSEIKEIWDIKTLLEKIPKLGAVIDLTNTARYYDPRELTAAGILHQKILMPGRIIPPEDKVQLFMDIVDEFLGKDCVAVQVKRARLGLSTAEVLVGVHCTHGLNRTGYMVCRYMRDRLNIPAKTAIKRFEVARGYQIERENYIADLLGKVPPPPDLNFKENKSKEIRPVRSRDMDKRPSIQDGDVENSRKREKYEKSRKSKDHKNMESKKDKTEGNWRNEARSSKTDDHYDIWSSWNKGKKNGESSGSRTRARTDSERSFDFKYDY